MPLRRAPESIAVEETTLAAHGERYPAGPALPTEDTDHSFVGGDLEDETVATTVDLLTGE